MADQVTPLQMAQQARKRSKQERLGDYYEAVTDVEEIYRHFAEQSWCTPADAALLTLSAILAVPEEEW